MNGARVSKNPKTIKGTDTTNLVRRFSIAMPIGGRRLRKFAITYRMMQEHTLCCNSCCDRVDAGEMQVGPAASAADEALGHDWFACLPAPVQPGVGMVHPRPDSRLHTTFWTSCGRSSRFLHRASSPEPIELGRLNIVIRSPCYYLLGTYRTDVSQCWKLVHESNKSADEARRLA
jgi:hypothetical protein